MKGLSMELSNGEKLILLMLSEIYEHLKIEGDIDPKFVRAAILREQTWSLACQYPGIIGSDESKTPPVVKEVQDILEMWELLETSYKRLQPADKARVEKEAEPFGSHVQFRGFDGNKETEYMGTAGFLVNDFERFSTFKGRDLNSHAPSLDSYRRMLTVFQPLRYSHDFDLLNAEQIINILKERTHPENR
jgi:uncharacterized protein YfbU (UPF0304 family)